MNDIAMVLSVCALCFAIVVATDKPLPCDIHTHEVVHEEVKVMCWNQLTQQPRECK